MIWPERCANWHLGPGRLAGWQRQPATRSGQMCYFPEEYTLFLDNSERAARLRAGRGDDSGLILCAMRTHPFGDRIDRVQANHPTISIHGTGRSADSRIRQAGSRTRPKVAYSPPGERR